MIDHVTNSIPPTSPTHGIFLHGLDQGRQFRRRPDVGGIGRCGVDFDHRIVSIVLLFLDFLFLYVLMYKFQYQSMIAGIFIVIVIRIMNIIIIIVVLVRVRSSCSSRSVRVNGRRHRGSILVFL